MKTSRAVELLAKWDAQKVYLFSTRDLAKLFFETGETLRATITRLISQGLLERVARGLYLNSLSSNISSITIEEIACRLRRGEYVYEGLESAASRWGIISQIPVNRLTVMTTGREGEFNTRFGVIEFTHTKASPQDICENTLQRDGHPLRISSKSYTIRNLKSCRRNVHLIDQDEVEYD